MGGPGSGRRPVGTARATVAEAYQLDAGELVWHGVIGCGVHVSTVFRWSGTPETRAAVRIESRCGSGDGSAVLSYALAGKAITMGVSLQTTCPNFGGKRWWLTCPQCGGRVGKLYLYPGDHFACRVCQGLGYASSRRSRAVGR